MTYHANIASPLAGLGGVGSSLADVLEKRAERGRQKELLEENRSYEEGMKESERLRVQKSGAILQDVTSRWGSNPSLIDVVTAQSAYNEQGGDPETWKQFSTNLLPFLKEQAKLGASQSLLGSIFPGYGGDQQIGSQDQGSLMGDTTLSQALPPEGQQVQSQGGALEEGLGDQGSTPQNQGGLPEEASPEQIAQLRTSPSQLHQGLADHYQNINDNKIKNFESDRTRADAINKKGRERVDELVETAPKRGRVIDLAKSAVDSGEIGSFSKNHWAEIIGGPVGDSLKTMTGTQFALSAKENLFVNASEIAARGLNQFVEMRMLDAFAKVGVNQSANTATLDFLKMENDIVNAYAKEYQRLEKEEERQTSITGREGYPKAYIEKRARQASAPEQQKIFNKYSVSEKKLMEKEKGDQWMYKQYSKDVIKGTPLTGRMARIFIQHEGGDPKNKNDQAAAIRHAKSLGYTVYTAAQLPEINR